MFTIGEILGEAEGKYFSGTTVETQLDRLYLQEQILLRTHFRRKTATMFDLVADQFLYPLGFSKDKIISVVVNGRKYRYEEIDDDTVAEPWLYTYENAIGIYPTPTTTVSGGILVQHYAEPKRYTLNDLSDYPTLENDFCMLLVYSLCIDAAETLQKDDMINGFTAKYNGLLKDFTRANIEPELPPIRVV